MRGLDSLAVQAEMRARAEGVVWRAERSEAYVLFKPGRLVMAEQTYEQREIQCLLAEYNSVWVEMNRRHSERYRFIALSLIILGIAGAFFGLSREIASINVKILALAIIPLPFITVMGLILKEHQYINMRDRYLETVLRPRLEQLAVREETSFSWMGWQEFEHKQMGREAGLRQRWQRFTVFMFFEAFDYGIPFIFAVASLGAYWFSRHQLFSHPLLVIADILAVANIVILFFLTFLICLLRIWEQRWYPRPPMMTSD